MTGQVDQSPVKLTQDKQEFSFLFCNFVVRFFFVYVVPPSVLSFKREVKNIYMPSE